MGGRFTIRKEDSKKETIRTAGVLPLDRQPLWGNPFMTRLKTTVLSYSLSGTAGALWEGVFVLQLPNRRLYANDQE
jgi:hypothetical protein